MIKPLTWALPLLALGIWWVVRGSVSPLRQLGRDVATRQLQSLVLLAAALNTLFERMADLLAAERQFTADAAHELRTPIAGIRMQAQVAQLLQLARRDADAEAAGRAAAPTDLAAVARAVVAELQATVQSRGQQLALELTDPTPVPLAEPLARVLPRNLLDNALRYGPEGAQVQVRVGLAQPGGPAQLCVQDSGPGLSDEEQARWGELFFRVLGSGQSGSGLGWSMVQRIARLHSLRVQVDRSPALGGCASASTGLEREQ